MQDYWGLAKSNITQLESRGNIFIALFISNKQAIQHNNFNKTVATVCVCEPIIYLSTALRCWDMRAVQL